RGFAAPRPGWRTVTRMTPRAGDQEAAEGRPVMAGTISRELAAELHRLADQASDIAETASALYKQLGGVAQRHYIDAETVGMDGLDKDAFCLSFIAEAEAVTA